MATDVTTIKVRKPVRDRINAAARSEQVSANDFIERLLQEHVRKQRIQQAKVAMQKMTPEGRESYHAETEAWDETLEDGLSA
ncbi:MAG: hypothetical protein WAS05_09510 [Candidatus Nanopelagicales bacterium]